MLKIPALRFRQVSDGMTAVMQPTDLFGRPAKCVRKLPVSSAIVLSEIPLNIMTTAVRLSKLKPTRIASWSTARSVGVDALGLAAR